MKKILFGIIPFFFLFMACDTAPAITNSPSLATTNSPSTGFDGMTLDQAIAEAAVRIDERIPAMSKIAPLNFNSTSDRFSSYVLDELTANLVDSGKLTVVDRREIDLIRSESNFQYSGDVSDDSMQTLGQMLGAQSIISGSLTDMGGFYRIVIRVLNVQNASVEVQYRANIVSDHVVSALLTGGRATTTVSASNGGQTAQTTQTQSQQTIQVPGQPSSQSSLQSAVVNVEGSSLSGKLQWIETNAANNTEYSIVINANETISSQILAFQGRRNITVRISGAGGQRVISNTGRGSLFTIESQVTLILESGVTLKGRSDNDVALVVVNSRGTLIMKAGAKITDNTNTYSSPGGGVAINENGLFRMEGGEIANNKAPNSDGGGIYVANDGSFIILGGIISNNTASYGGGVSTSGKATIQGGEISGNTVTMQGGGVYSTGTLTMTGGEILGNSASYLGGGLFCSSEFIKTGGTIYGNTGDSNENWAKERGHAVSSFYGHRNSTAGPNVKLDLSKSGSAGGWED